MNARFHDKTRFNFALKNCIFIHVYTVESEAGNKRIKMVKNTHTEFKKFTMKKRPTAKLYVEHCKGRMQTNNERPFTSCG